MANGWGGKRVGSGRPAGALNKRSREMVERLDRLGLDPIAALARLAQHAEAEGNLALAERCWRGLMPYAGPKPAVPRQVLPGPDSASSAPAIELPSWWRPGRAS
jgi:hypothetical protein